MKKMPILIKYLNRIAFILLHGGMFVIALGYAVMLFIDAAAWEGWFSIFKALFSTYNPYIYKILVGNAVIIGWACVSIAGVLSVFTVVFISKQEFKSTSHQLSQAAFVFLPMIVIAFIMFFKGNRPAIQTVSLLGWITVCTAFVIHSKYLPQKMKGASELTVSVMLFTALFFIVNVYAFRHDAIFDVSTARFYSLSPTTRKLVENMDKKVKVYVILYPLRARKTMIYDYTQKLFNQISNASDNVSVEFVSPSSRKADTIRKKYGITENHEALILECGEKAKAIPIENSGEPLAVLKARKAANPFMQQEIPEIEAYKGENVFYLAINEITSEKKKQILFLEGHGERSITEYSERSISDLSNELKNLNYEVLTTTLRQGELPVCDTLVITSPRTKFADWEIELIKRYLKEKNGSLMYFPEPIVKERSIGEAGLADLMADYGIKIRNDYIILNAVKLNIQLDEISTDTYGYHPITKSFTTEQVYMKSARSLREGSCKEPRMNNTSLFSATSGSDYKLWGETRIGMKIKNIAFDQNDNPSPFDLALLAGPRESFVTPRIIVIGDADIVSNQLLKKGNNKRFLLNCFNWTMKQKDVDIIEPRKYEFIKVDVSDDLMANIGYLVVICLPGFIMLYGALVLIRRRA